MVEVSTKQWVDFGVLEVVGPVEVARYVVEQYSIYAFYPVARYGPTFLSRYFLDLRSPLRSRYRAGGQAASHYVPHSVEK